jgi:hypothetical protein
MINERGQKKKHQEISKRRSVEGGLKENEDDEKRDGERGGTL